VPKQDVHTSPHDTTLAARAALGVLGLIVGLLTCEGILRWVVPYRCFYRHPEFIVREVDVRDREERFADPRVGPVLAPAQDGREYRLKRNVRAEFVSSEFDVSFETDDRGLRGPHARGPGELRILGLGDSFTMGFGVEADETFLSVLQRHLTRRGPRTVEVINAGVPGYNPFNSYRYLVDDGLAFDPAIVVLQLWAGDDLCGAPQAAHPVEWGDAPFALRTKTIIRNFHLAMFLRDRLRGAQPVRRWLLRYGALDRFEAPDLLSVHLGTRCAAELAALASLLAEYQAVCARRGIRFVVLLIPMREQVYEADWERDIAYGMDGVDPSAVDFDAPNRIVRGIAEQDGIELVDTLGPLRDRSAEGRAYFAGFDVHLTALGHRIVGTTLFRALVKERKRAGRIPDATRAAPARG
jgi:hypothetical protein